MLGSTSWWSYDGLTFASFLLHQCATSQTFHRPGKPLLNLDIFSSLDIHPRVAILLHGSMQCARITASLRVNGCCWRGVWVWAHWTPATAYSEALSFPSSRCVPSTCPVGRSRRGRRAAACSFFALKGLTPTGKTWQNLQPNNCCTGLWGGLLKSSSFL